MGHKSKKSLFDQTEEVLKSKLRIGESKHEAKEAARQQGRRTEKGQLQLDGIYSWSTYRTYLKHITYFTDWCKKNYRCKTLEQCREHIDEWLQLRISKGLSAWTIKMEVSALAKLYGVPAGDLTEIKTPDRKRADIKRSREDTVRDAHFSEKNHEEIVFFEKSVGLRREGLTIIRGTDYRIDDYGQMWVHIREKGGKYRFIPVKMANKNRVKAIMDAAGDGRVFPEGVPNAMDVHGYRGAFAVDLYKSLARPLKKIPKKDQYRCRNDRKGIILDKKAMFLVSQALGHNRINVIAENYLYDLTPEQLNDVYGDTLFREEMYPGVPKF